MPSRITVIHLSEVERGTLNAAATAGAAKKIGDEIAAVLKAGDAAVRALVASRDITREGLRAAEEALASKDALLAQLPEGGARSELLGEVQASREIVAEAGRMLGDF